MDDTLGVKLYDFVLTCLEPLTGLTNSEVVFTVESANAPFVISITVVDATLIADQVYLVNDPAITLAAPSYTYFPSYPAIEWEYTQTTTYPFIQVLNGSVKIETTNPLDTGYYKVDILAKEVLSGLSHTTSFNVRITCVRSITPSATISDELYYIRQAKRNIMIPLLNLNPALCPNELVYTL